MEIDDRFLDLFDNRDFDEMSDVNLQYTFNILDCRAKVQTTKVYSIPGMADAV